MTAAKVKKKAWKLFSEYIRRSNADRRGRVKCVTCGLIMHWKESQAGHFVGGRNNSVLLREDLVHPQCYRCNCCLSGNQGKYVLYMMDTYKLTRRKIDSLLNLRNSVKRMTKADWQEEVDKWSKKLKELDD